VFVEAWAYLLAHQQQFGDALGTHVALSASALGIAIAVAVPLGIWLADTRRAALIAINAANIGRTLPSLAVLALMMPILGTGFAPALFALTLLALPPILVNTCTAIRQVDADDARSVVQGQEIVLHLAAAKGGGITHSMRHHGSDAVGRSRGEAARLPLERWLVFCGDLPCSFCG
jgi:hypothetical protein